MASVAPVAFVILVAMAGAILLPLLWWVLALWQRKNKLLGLFKISMILSIIPIFSVLALYYGKEFSAKYSVIFFALTPFISAFLLAAVFGVTVNKVRNSDL
ncbi:MAG TPA: hypothetical protein VIC08_10570 [Cellvibrionaceae bacterium]